MKDEPVKEKIYIGVDLGGTKIMTGAMTANGKLCGEPVQVPTIGIDAAINIITRLTDSIEKVMRGIDTSTHVVEGIGLGVTGPLDCKNGIILDCPQLPTLHNFPLKKEIESTFSLPVKMNNDANCLIYGETLFGSGMGKSSVVGFTLGTGLGCAIVIDRKIFAGFTESAGEVWTSPYRDGIIEDLVSGAGVAKLYHKISGKEASAKEIAEAAEQGDDDALATWEEFGTHLSVAMAWTINLIDPELVILGGSIANAYKFFAPAMEKNLRAFLCAVPAGSTKVVTARLGAHAGCIGAAALVV